MEAVCRLFSARLGAGWYVVPGPAPDEAHREEKAPDALISDGKITAAVEVTQLTGGETLHRYLTSKPALKRELTKALPESFQGTLWICPPDGFALPVTRELVTQLQRLVAEVAPTVSAENPQSYIRFPMMGWLLKTRNNHHTEWLCRHSRSQFHIVLERKGPPGIYYLYDECDDGLWSHPEVEDENMLLDSISSLIEAAASMDNNDRQEVQWHDLWQVIFVPSAPRNVSVLAISKVYSLPDSALQDVSSAIQRKISKFSERSWADLHVLALVVPLRLEHNYLLALREDLPGLVDLGNLDVVVAVYQGEASLLWQRDPKLRRP